MRQRLLDTPAERVPPELAASLRSFCEPIDAIHAAYVGLTELTVEFHEPREQLAVAFELAEPVAETKEGDRELRLVADRFYETMPEEVVAGGCNFLEPGGLDAWQEKASRSSPAERGDAVASGRARPGGLQGVRRARALPERARRGGRVRDRARVRRAVRAAADRGRARHAALVADDGPRA